MNRKNMSMKEWMEVQNTLTKVAQYTTCPEGASFSMAGERHTLYTDGRYIYKTVDANGGGAWYKYDI